MVGGNSIQPEEIASNINWIEQNREFLDGVVLNVRNVSGNIMTNTPISYSTVDSALSSIKNLNSSVLKDNFVIVFNNKPADPFDDWSGCIQNWKTLARAVKAAGLAGIIYDDEQYSGFTYWSNYPDNIDYPEKSLTEYEAQVRLRGQQIVQAITSEFSDIVLLQLHSPAISDPNAPRPLFPNYSHANELKGPFFVGLTQARGSATIVDGGELYALRSVDDFSLAYNYMKYTMPQVATFVPDSFRSQYSQNVSISFGVYNKTYHDVYLMNASIIKPTVYNALSRADDYVWLYFENTDLVVPEGIGEDWVNSLSEAKAEYLVGAGTGPSEACFGDANADKKVDGVDYVIWLQNYGGSVSEGCSKGDFNADKKVDGVDYVIWLQNYAG